MTNISKSPESPIMLEDKAQTFAESDVTLSNTETEIAGESVSLKNQYGTSADRNADESQYDRSDGRGIEINPNRDLSGVQATISSNAQGSVSTVFISDSNDNLLNSETGSFSAGDVVDLRANLASGTEYYVGVYDDGATYNVGVRNTNSAPYTSADIDITNGAYGFHPDDGSGVSTTSNLFAVRDVTAIVPNSVGEVMVSWPQPADVFDWDRASFTTTEDGETVDIYVEESTDDGSTWTEIAGPIERGDSIPADPGSRVRFRVDISRSDASNNPTLDSIYRRWVV